VDATGAAAAVAVLAVEATLVAADDAGVLALESGAAGSEVTAETACPAADATVVVAVAALDAGTAGAAGVLDFAGPAAVLGAAGALVTELDDAGALDVACELDPVPEPVSAEVAEVTVERAWPTTDDGAALLAAGALDAATAPGPVAADAGLAVRNDRPRNTPMAATAIPAAHRQDRRTLMTGPGNALVTSVTITRRSWLV
jgi:hypothetical protein